MSAVAVAAKFGAPEHMGEEIKAELAKDLAVDRFLIGAPRQVFEPAPVWASVSGTASYWADELRKQRHDYIEQAGRAMAEKLDRDILAMCTKLARKIDADLAAEKIPVEKQLIVGMPELSKTRYGAWQLEAGAAKKTTFFGDEIRVEYIRPTEIYLPS